MFRLSNITTKYRSKIMIQTYRKVVKSGQKILDVGCGNGIVSKILADTFALNLIGCDILDYLSVNIKFKKMLSPNKLPFTKTDFAFVMFNDVLHHIEKDNQLKLLKDSLRIGKRVLIFEDEPTLTNMAIDYALNKIHNPLMKIPYTHRSQEDWIRIFKSMKANYKILEIKTSNLYPLKHIAFLVQKSKIS